MPTTTESRRKVLATLQQTGKPLTERMIMERSGLARNTVRAALDDLGVEPQVIANAHVYSIHQSKEPEARIRWRNNVILQNTGKVVAVDLVKVDAVTDYNKMVHRIAAALPARLTPSTDPAEAARALSEYVVLLSSIATELQKNQNNPEWYGTLGGFNERLETA